MNTPSPSTERRRFLKTLAAAGVAAAFPPAVAAADFQKSDGQSYAPKGKPHPVVKPGEFLIAAAYLDHNHILGQCNGLTEAGAEIKWVYDSDPKKVAAFQQKFPAARAARSYEEILDDPAIKLVAAAAIPSERGAIGCRAMQAGKDYFSDKPPFTTLEQLAQAKQVVAQTGRKYFMYYSERLHVESAVFATQLVQEGAIGRVIHVLGIGPHREGTGRPEWFYDPARFGGILCDIGSHQFEQFLTYSGATDATVMHAAVGNYAHRSRPEFQDFGESSLLGNNGALNFIRVDWFTPDGLSTWGDGRVFILGEKGYIELRKYVDIGRDDTGDHVYIVDEKSARRIDCSGKVGYPFFGQFILDCIHRTENAMTQEHAFKAAELCLKAQGAARFVTKA